MSAESQTQGFAAPGAYSTQLSFLSDILEDNNDLDDVSFSSSTTVTAEEIRDEMQSSLEEILSAVLQVCTFFESLSGYLVNLHFCPAPFGT